MTATPCITVWQPWASLISFRAKTWEFRSWSLPRRLVGSRIGIHAGSRAASKSETLELLIKLQSPAWRETGVDPGIAVPLLTLWLDGGDALPLGSILCTAAVGEPVRNEELAERLGVESVNDSDRVEHSNFGWPLSDVRQVQPIVPTRGLQGIWMFRGEL